MKNITLTIDARALKVEALQRQSKNAMLAWMTATDPVDSAFWYASMESFARQARLAASPVTLAASPVTLAVTCAPLPCGNGHQPATPACG